MDKLVLAVTDGSAAGQGALGWAAALCAATDSTLSVATAWQPEFSEMDPATYAQHLEAARQRLEDDWCAILWGSLARSRECRHPSSRTMRRDNRG